MAECETDGRGGRKDEKCETGGGAALHCTHHRLPEQNAVAPHVAGAGVLAVFQRKGQTSCQKHGPRAVQRKEDEKKDAKAAERQEDTYWFSMASGAVHLMGIFPPEATK